MTEQDTPEETPEEAAAPPGDADQGGQPADADGAPAAASAEEAPAAKPERKAAAPAGPATAVVVPRQLPGAPIVTRRRVLLVGFWSGLGAIVAGLAAGGLDMIYPSTVTGFGGKVTVPANDVPPPGGKKEIPEGRFWLVNLTEEQGGPGLLALWWKCPHLGCTVPWVAPFVWPDPTTGADKLGWFRCPCHGSTYTDAGIRVFGPAPRSLDTMSLVVEDDGRVTVDTGATTNGGPDNPDRAVRL